MVNEEITKSEIRNIIKDTIEDYIKEQTFKKKIREISTDVLQDFFKEMWYKRGFWKNSVKNG